MKYWQGFSPKLTDIFKMQQKTLYTLLALLLVTSSVASSVTSSDDTPLEVPEQELMRDIGDSEVDASESYSRCQC